MTAAEQKTLVFDFGVYTGEVSSVSGRRHGWGQLAYDNGNVYEGEWREGAVHGSGAKSYRNGDVYSGEWREGKREGKGEYKYAHGHKYTGEYKHDVCHGLGTLLTREGDKYTGEWQAGRKHGAGTEVLRDGQTFVGRWSAGKKSGEGVLTTKTERITGTWQDDRCVDVASRQEMEYQPQVRQLSMSRASSASTASSNLMVPPETLQQMRLAGADDTMLQALLMFGNRMDSQVGNLLGSIDTIESQLGSLTETLEGLTGLDSYLGVGDEEGEENLFEEALPEGVGALPQYDEDMDRGE
jgi:hypothetical protein